MRVTECPIWMTLLLLSGAAADGYGEKNSPPVVVVADTDLAESPAAHPLVDVALTQSAGGSFINKYKNCGTTTVGFEDFGLAIKPKRLGFNGSTTSVDDTIVGGKLAVRNQLCWQVTLNHACGGTILGPTTILTAAHCFFDKETRKQVNFANNTDVTTGALTSALTSPRADPTRCADIYKIKEVFLHPNYVYGKKPHDIAVLILEKPINLTAPCSCPMCLTNMEPKAGERCLVSGTGRTVDGMVQTNRPMKYVTQVVRNNGGSDCATGSGLDSPTDFTRLVCAFGAPGEDSCQGDSGGPFVCQQPDGRLYSAGTVSFGAAAGCGKEPGAQYTKTKFYLDWIVQTAKQDFGS
ncbi:putative Transmembrane protease serine 9 [Hypsibius exemplaris]|uniref:Transmembrane protease serine 9 n=1 Tax=Hypsibius exemplaris TaxID=2072580 RepID=A0A1W0X5D4_HYPEX|nr:putative Transmembrane protease serine 9 [Hypsibius exemplaris]